MTVLPATRSSGHAHATSGARVRATMRVALAALALTIAGAGACAHRPAPGNFEESVAKRITVSEDTTIFTLFCMLNAAGYDLENGETMHPVRLQVRAELERRVPKELRARVRAYYQAHGKIADPWAYSVAAKATSGPPAFEPTAEWASIRAERPFSSLDDLHGLLRDFYAEARVGALYEPLRPAYQEYRRAYESAVRREVAAVLTYCRLTDVARLSDAPSQERPNALVIPNLLDSYEHAFSFVLEGRFTSVEGPQLRVGYHPHEFVHAVTNPAVYTQATRFLDVRMRSLIQEGVRALGDERLGSVEAFVDENLVRAVSLRYLAADKPERLLALSREMMEEYRAGYILERFFWEQLSLYEKAADVDLRGYYPRMIARLDPDMELHRWSADRSAARP
jgi:nitrite reductase/ring-hydroxylating ferredoxin subunit